MMQSWLLFIPLISAYVYKVNVKDAKDLSDEDTDFLWITNLNDVYVEIYGYGENDAYKMETTSIITSATPEWNETFIFDDESDGNGAYNSFLFKLYDSDEVLGSNINPPDFLGEAGPVYTSEITDCDDIFGAELDVSNGGTLFVIFTKSGCDGGDIGSSTTSSTTTSPISSTTTTTTSTTKKPGGPKGAAAATEGGNSLPETCLLDDIVYQDGDTIGHIGYTCLPESDVLYVGTESKCSNGEVIETPYTGDCGEEYTGSTCCQQGAPGTFGGAVCITRDCEEYEDEDTDYEGVCVVGDMMYRNGETIGVLGDRCITDAYYEGTRSVCVDGGIEDFVYYGDCTIDGDTADSVCCPTGIISIIGGVECMAESECDEEVEPDEGEDCLVGDIMYQHGQTTGYEGRTCIDDMFYSGTEGVCLDGDITRFDRFGDCSQENPGSVCCQQNEPDTYGAAVCVEAELCVEYDDGEFPEFSTTDSSEEDNGDYEEEKKSGTGKTVKGKEKGEKPK